MGSAAEGRIACRRHGLCVTEELSDYRKAETYTSGHAREAMAKVMNTHVVCRPARTRIRRQVF